MSALRQKARGLVDLLNPRGRKLFEWMEAVLAAPELTDTEAKVAVRLGLHCNHERGRCDPSVVGLADRTAKTRRGVQKALNNLRGKGWVTWVQGGHGYGNRHRYRLTFPVDFRANGGSPLVADSRANGLNIQGEPPDTLVRTPVRPNTKNTKEYPDPHKGELDYAIMAMEEAGGPDVLNQLTDEARNAVADEWRARAASRPMSKRELQHRIQLEIDQAGALVALPTPGASGNR